MQTQFVMLYDPFCCLTSCPNFSLENNHYSCDATYTVTVINSFCLSVAFEFIQRLLPAQVDREIIL